MIHGQPQESIIEVANAFSYCMEPNTEYYLFLTEVRGAGEKYIEDTGAFQSPSNYTIGSFGKANSFKADQGRVRAEERIGHSGIVRYEDVPESQFRSDLSTSVAELQIRYSNIPRIGLVLDRTIYPRLTCPTERYHLFSRFWTQFRCGLDDLRSWWSVSE